MRHLGVAGRVPVHRFDTQPLRHIDRPVLRHHETAAVFEKTAVEKARVAHDTGRVARLAGHYVRSAFRLVGIARATVGSRIEKTFETFIKKSIYK